MLSNNFNIINRRTTKQISKNKTCLIDLGKTECVSYSYKKIHNASIAFAKKLIQKKLIATDKIAVVLENSVEFVVILLAAVRCGVVPVLINPRLSPTQIENIIKESHCKMVFDSKNSFIDFENLLDGQDCEIYAPSSTDPIFILYTSGSSGLPKGVIISHKNYYNMLSQNDFVEKDSNGKHVSLISSPLYYSMGLISFFTSYDNYSTIVLFPRFDATSYIKAIEKFKVDSLYCAPSMLSMLLQEEQLLKKTNLLSVNYIICASSDISQQLVENIYKYFTRAQLRNTYGSTEVGGGLLFGPHPIGLPTPRGSVGYPNKNFQCRLVDGILEIKGPLLAQGYTNKKELFKEDGFFSTNDLFEIDDNGFYYFLGRADNMFKCGGYSVYPESIESMLEEHPAVMSAAVIAVPDEVKGHKPYAFVLRNADITETELKEYALKNGPSYQHPRRIWFVDVMPLNGTNKIDKKELMKRAIVELNLHH